MSVGGVESLDRCWYCRIEKRPDVPVAVATIHDRRGCKDVCAEHAKWRLSTSFAFGHSLDCPVALQTRYKVEYRRPGEKWQISPHGGEGWPRHTAEETATMFRQDGFEARVVVAP